MFYSFHLYLFVTPFHFLLAIIGLFCLLLQFTNTNTNTNTGDLDSSCHIFRDLEK